MKKFRVAITTGDTDGIGLEVAEKALRKIKIPKDIQLILVFHSGQKIRVPQKFRSSVSDLNPKNWNQESDIVLIPSKESPAVWVEKMAQLCLQGHVSSLATGPLSKGLIYDSGLKDLGHTDILKRVSGSKKAFMSFFGKHFHVVLASGHLPLEKVAESLNEDLLTACLEATHSATLKLPKSRQKLPIAVLGLNPHAGDGGIIGDFEKSVLNPLLGRLRKKFPIEGPLVPDVAFQKQNWKKYSFYVALYHDQGLIPFKMAHGFRGAHLTLGLPIKRSSVDHGTAKDIFGKNKADESSMVDAITWAIQLARGQ